MNRVESVENLTEQIPARTTVIDEQLTEEQSSQREVDEIAIMRDSIDALDEAIINLAAERTRVQARIQNIKISTGQARVELGRERQIMDNVTQHARKKGLDEETARSLIDVLIKRPMGRRLELAANIGNGVVDGASKAETIV